MTADAPEAVHQVAAGEPGCGPWWPGSTVSYLAGDWDVVREIADHRSGQAGKFRGRASFRPAGDRTPHGVLDFTEEGELRFGEYSGPASRSLRYHGRSDGSADVHFADGREFYRVHLGFGSCHAVHRCRADRYKVIVTRLSADSFSEIWRVTGPAKDYDLTTVYTRAGCTA